MKYTLKITTVNIIEVNATSEEEAINIGLSNIKPNTISGVEIVKEEEIEK